MMGILRSRTFGDMLPFLNLSIFCCEGQGNLFFIENIKI